MEKFREKKEVVTDMYDGTATGVRTSGGETCNFFFFYYNRFTPGISIELYLFVLFMDELARLIQEEVHEVCCLPMIKFWLARLERG